MPLFQVAEAIVLIAVRSSLDRASDGSEHLPHLSVLALMDGYLDQRGAGIAFYDIHLGGRSNEASYVHAFPQLCKLFPGKDPLTRAR